MMTKRVEEAGAGRLIPFSLYFLCPRHSQVLASSKHTALPLPLPSTPLSRLPIIPRRARAGARGSEISRLAPEIRADPPAAAFSSGEAVGRAAAAAAAARSVSFRRRIGGTLPASGAFRFLCWPPRSGSRAMVRSDRRRRRR